MKKTVLLYLAILVGFADVFSQDTISCNDFGQLPGIYADSSLPKVINMDYLTELMDFNCAKAISVVPNKGMYIYGIAAPFWTEKEWRSDSSWHEVWQPDHSGFYHSILPMDTTDDNCFEYFQYYKKTASRGDTVELTVIEQGMVHVLDSNVIGYLDLGANVPSYVRRYVPIRAIYFDHPIYVTDTFYIGMTNYNCISPENNENRTWIFASLTYSGGGFITTQRSYFRLSREKNIWKAAHSSPTPWNPNTYYFTYYYIFPLVDSVPMYPSPLVTGGGMAGAPVVTVDDFVSVSPNPATGMATVKSSFGINAVGLYDLGGALLLSQTASGLTHTLDLRPYAAGVYILKVRTPNGTATKKIVKH